MGDLDQQLILDVGERVLMGEQQRAASGAEQRKDQRRSGARIRPVRTHHSKMPKPAIRITKTRCCATSGSRRLSKKPISPSGQTSGSERKKRNTASPTKSSGQCRAHGAAPDALAERQQADQQHRDAGPMVIVFRPGDVLGVARRRHAGARHEGGGQGVMCLGRVLARDLELIGDELRSGRGW